VAPPGGALDLAVTCGVSRSFQGQYRAFAEALVAELARIGVRVTLAPSRSLDPHHDLTLIGWIADYPDPDGFAWMLTSAGRAADYCDLAEIDALVEQGRASPSTAERRAIYQEIERVIADQALLVPLFHQTTWVFSRPEVRGLDPSVVGALTQPVDYAELWVEP
jgi:ABC-type transport system substrate-binding protein